MGVAHPAMQRHDLGAGERAGGVPPGVRMDGPCDFGELSRAAFCRIAFSMSPCGELVEPSAIAVPKSDNQSHGPKEKGRSGVRPRTACVLWLRAGDQPVRRASWLSGLNPQGEYIASKRFRPIPRKSLRIWYETRREAVQGRTITFIHSLAGSLEDRIVGEPFPYDRKLVFGYPSDDFLHH